MTSIAIQTLGSRNDDAGRCLRWAAQATQALDYLKDLHEALPKSRELSGGHDVLAIQVAHARWASATSMTAIDLCAAALGYLYLPRCSKDAYYDFRQLCKKITTVRTHPGTTEWIDQVNNNADFKLIDGIRDPLVHRTLPRRYAVDFTSADTLVDTAMDVIGYTDPIPVAEIVLASRRCARMLVGSFMTRASTGRI